MLKYFKSNAIISASTLSLLIISFLKGKFSAVYLGAEGIGIFSNIAQFQMTLFSLVSMGLNYAVLKYAQKETKENLEISDLLTHCFLIELFFFLIIIIFGLPFISFFSNALFTDTRWSLILVFVVISIPFLSFSHLLNITFISRQLYPTYSRVMIVSNISFLIIFASLVLIFELKGALLSCAITPIASFILSTFFLKRSLKDIKILPILKNTFTFTISPLILKKLLSYSWTFGLSNGFVFISSSVIRYLIIHKLGAAQNGYFHGLTVISTLLTTFISNSLWSQFYVDIGNTKNSGERKLEILNALKYCIWLFMPCFFVLSLFSHTLVMLLFTKDFLTISSLLPIQFVIDFIFICTNVFGFSLVAQGHLKMMLLMTFVKETGIIIGSFLIVPTHGLPGILSVLLFGQSFFFISCLAWYMSYNRFWFSREVIFFLAYSLSLISIFIFIPNNTFYYIVGIIIWLLMCPKKDLFLFNILYFFIF